MTVAFSFFTTTASVTCSHCKDMITGCAGGDACPLVANVLHNRAIFESGAMTGDLKLSELLTVRLTSLFPQAVCKQLIGLSSAPAGGREVDLSDGSYERAGDVVRAVFCSHCTPEAGMMELVTRMDGTADADDMTRLKSAIDLLKSKGDATISGPGGQLSFILAKVSGHASPANLLRLHSPTSRASGSELTAKLVRPTTQQDFFELVFLFVWAIVAFGIVEFPTAMQIIDDLVFRPLRELADFDWHTSYQLLLVYISEIENDPTRTLHLGNVYSRGKHDSLLSKAKAAAVFFRTRGGTPRGATPSTSSDNDSSTTKTWNGKWTTGAPRVCYAYNTGKPHQAANLRADGTCMHDHVCMQFVSDKGKGGQCRGKHAWTECTYDASKKRTTAQP